MKKDFKVLPNPNAKREPIIPECKGCDRIYDHTQGLTGNYIAVDNKVCIPYLSPKAKWRIHSTGEIIKKVKGKDKKILIHFNPCVMATHVFHYVEPKNVKGRVGQQKQRGR